MRNKILVVVLLIATTLIVGYIAYEEFMHTKSTNEAKENYKNAVIESEAAKEDVVESSLNLYYVFYGRYPADTDSLIEGLSNKKNYELLDREPSDTTILVKIVNSDLNNFEYSVRGDKKAYKFTYLSSDGETKEVIGEYQKEFH